jgi:flagellar basal-body rod protein FlgB
MTTENIGLFKAINAKMSYLQTRQKVISQNISNANTPGYKPSDLGELNFGSTLDNVTKSSGIKKVTMESTDPGHISPDAHMQASVQKSKTTYEVKPDKNAVDIEEQMTKASDVQMNYNLMLNVYSNNMDMVRMSLGRRS